MKPISPVVPGCEDKEFLLAKDQPEYFPIPTLVSDPDFTYNSKWEFDDAERDAIAKGANLFFRQTTFGKPFQPVSLQIVWPD